MVVNLTSGHAGRVMDIDTDQVERGSKVFVVFQDHDGHFVDEFGTVERILEY